jgi:hypothetical protein
LIEQQQSPMMPSGSCIVAQAAANGPVAPLIAGRPEEKAAPAAIRWLLVSRGVDSPQGVA